MRRRDKAGKLVQKANRLEGQGRWQEALERYEEAAEIDPTWSAPLYNLGLLYKKQRKWRKSFDYNRRATTLDSENDGAWWNLGSAATALGRWQSARHAWRSFGIDLPDGEGPIDFPCGYGPIRLNPDGDAEIVWAHRIDPARAELSNIPFPESGFRW